MRVLLLSCCPFVLGLKGTLLSVRVILRGRTRAKGNSVVLLGNVGAGKTALFFSLQNDARPTHSSIKENIASFVPAGLTQVTITGHYHWLVTALPVPSAQRLSVSCLCGVLCGVRRRHPRFVL